MKPLNLMSTMVIASACFVSSGHVSAATIQTIGAGSAVTSIDRSASFGSMTSSQAINLDTYSEGGLRITTSGTSWGEDPSLALYDPFHGANSPDHAFYSIAYGNNDWVTIQTVDHKKIFGVEFMYGNGWTTGDIYGTYPWGNNNATVDWQTFNGGTLVSSGTIGVSPLLEMGTILGFNDLAGFDQLLVRSSISGSGDPTLQAIALDNLQVQVSSVPLPATYAMLASGLGLLGSFARRCRKSDVAA